jgi:hypothetical protein
MRINLIKVLLPFSSTHPSSIHSTTTPPHNHSTPQPTTSPTHFYSKMSGRGKGGGGLGKHSLNRYADPGAESDSDSDCEIIGTRETKKPRLSKQQAEWALAKEARAEAAKEKEIRDTALIQEKAAAQKKQEAEREAQYAKLKQEQKEKQAMEDAAEVVMKKEAKAKLQAISKEQTKKPLLFIYGDGDGGVYTAIADHPVFNELSGFVPRKDFMKLFDDHGKYFQIASLTGTDEPIRDNIGNKLDLMMGFLDAFSSPAFGDKTRGTVMLTDSNDSNDSDCESDCSDW